MILSKEILKVSGGEPVNFVTARAFSIFGGDPYNILIHMDGLSLKYEVDEDDLAKAFEMESVENKTEEKRFLRGHVRSPILVPKVKLSKQFKTHMTMKAFARLRFMEVMEDKLGNNTNL